MKVKCNKCGYIGEESEFPKDRDFFQFTFVKKCPKNCGNSQSPGDASMRMMPLGTIRPFEYIRPESKDKSQLGKTIHRAKEAS